LLNRVPEVYLEPIADSFVGVSGLARSRKVCLIPRNVICLPLRTVSAQYESEIDLVLDSAPGTTTAFDIPVHGVPEF
jgi:hypothetical protein